MEEGSATAKFPFSNFSPLSVSPYSGLKTNPFSWYVNSTFQLPFHKPPLSLLLSFLLCSCFGSCLTLQTGHLWPGNHFCTLSCQAKGTKKPQVTPIPSEPEEQNPLHLTFTVLFPHINFLDPCHSPYFLYLYLLFRSSAEGIFSCSQQQKSGIVPHGQCWVPQGQHERKREAADYPILVSYLNK